MKTFARPLLAALSVLALAACNNNTSDTADSGMAEATPTAEPLPTETTLASPVASPAANVIPAAIQGRWGMGAADCEPGRDDAKGLLVIDGTKLEFYESVGTLDGIEEASDTRIRADFDFTGEGMTWERDVVLEVQDDGGTLVRQEYGDDATPGPFRYSKCS